MRTADLHGLTELVTDLSTLADALDGPSRPASLPGSHEVEVAVATFCEAWRGGGDVGEASIAGLGERVAAAGMALVEGDPTTVAGLLDEGVRGA